MSRSTSVEDTHESGRDSWWRGHIRDTPIPGTYEVSGMVEELDAVKIHKTYGFKSSGRKKVADPSKTGSLLMPGLYKTKGFVEDNAKKKLTYNFKSTNRDDKNAVVVGRQDKEILKSDISPIKYAQDYKTVKKLPSNHAAFKSQSARFPTIYFKPKEGPSPTEYDASTSKTRGVSSAFASQTPRFKKVHVLKTPGPGAYTKMLQYPMPKHIHEVGRYHGVYFPPGVF